MNRIDALFARKRESGGKSLVIFVQAGFPDLDKSVEIAIAAAEAGADLIEFGVPFSDPIADGPTIQRSSQIALERGATLAKILEGAAEFRRRSETPLVLFGACNPFFRRGIHEIVGDAKKAGADGFIIPDVPPEEAGPFEEACRAGGMDLIYLLAPTSPPDRKRMIAKRSSGFVYYITVAGVTGARRSLPEDLKRQVDEIKSLTDLPVAIGFGIATPDQARQGADVADAVVVGSAFVQLVMDNENSPDLPGKVRDYVRSLATALSMAGAA